MAQQTQPLAAPADGPLTPNGASMLPALSPARQSVQQSGADFDANAITLKSNAAKRVTVLNPRAHVRSYDRFMLYQLKQRVSQQGIEPQSSSVGEVSHETN